MKILIVDDHPLIREALRHVLPGLAADIRLYDASDCAGGLALAEQHQDLDLALLDLTLPGFTGMYMALTGQTMGMGDLLYVLSLYIHIYVHVCTYMYTHMCIYSMLTAVCGLICLLNCSYTGLATHALSPEDFTPLHQVLMAAEFDEHMEMNIKLHFPQPNCMPIM